MFKKISFLGALFVFSLAFAEVDSKVICTGEGLGKKVEFTLPFDSYSGLVESDQKFTFTVDGKRPEDLSYEVPSQVYLSERLIAVGVINDGTETVINIEYLGKDNALNRFQVGKYLLTNEEYSGELVELAKVACKKEFPPEEK